MEKLYNNIKHTLFVIFYRTWDLLAPIIPDKLFLFVKYRIRLGVWPNLSNPSTFNEKLQWLKLNDRKSIYTTMVDKHLAKLYVAKLIGPEYIVPTYQVWNTAEDINFDLLPNQFVLKVTHDSGGIAICKDKSLLNKKEVVTKLKKGLKRNYYYQNREWPYKNVDRKIIAEKYLGGNVDDYVSMVSNKGYTLLYSFTNLMSYNYTILSNYELDTTHCKDLLTNYLNKDKLEEFIKILEFININKIALSLQVILCNKLVLANLTVKDSELTGQLFLSQFNKLTNWSIIHGSILNDQPSQNLPESKLPFYSIVPKFDLIDYKFYCFNGIPKFLYVSKGLNDHKTAQISFLDLEWKILPFRRNDYRAFDSPIEKPIQFDRMIEIAKKLSEGTHFLRVDLYEYLDHLYFSEMTFYPCSGMMPFNPIEWDNKVGNLLKL